MAALSRDCKPKQVIYEDEVATLHSTGAINRQPYHRLSALSLYLFLYFV